MGSVSAMESVDRVLKKYSTQIKPELRREYPSRLIGSLPLENGIYSIEIEAELTDGTLLDMKVFLWHENSRVTVPIMGRKRDTF